MSYRFKLFILLIVSLLILVLSPMLGGEFLSYSSLYNGTLLDESKLQIFWQIRLPRILLGFLVGSSLAVGGVVFQALFRNPLATPYTLGVASGASCGATLAVSFGFLFSFFFFNGVVLAALGGSLLSILFVYLLSSSKKGFSSNEMLLAGVAINFFFSSLVLFMQYMSDFTQSFRIIRWLMGELVTVGYASSVTLLPFCFLGLFSSLVLASELDILSTGEEIARSRGVSVDKLRKLLFVLISLMIGAVVAVSGPIGFVGIIVPHVSRIFVGSNHKKLIIFSFILGGAFLVFCDTLARMIIAPAEIPVGVITALLGGPFFLYLLMQRKLA